MTDKSPDSKPDQEPPGRPVSESDAVAKDIAFGVQQTLACWATDAIDPPLSKFIQNRIGDQEHKVTDKHVWYGEILGDTAAFFEYLALKKLFRAPIAGLAQGTKKLFDPVFDRVGRKHLKHWAEERHLSQDDSRYRERLDKDKDFQARAAVDSTIVAAGATLSNVGIQKYFGNRQSIKVILASKLAGAAITLGLMVGVRTVVPNATERLDEELSDRYFSRITHFLQRLAGVRPSAHIDDSHHGKHDPAAAPAAAATANAAMTTMGGALTHFTLGLDPVKNRLGELSKAKHAGALVAGGVAATAAAHLLVPESVKLLKHEVSERYFPDRHEEHKKKKNAGKKAGVQDKRWRDSVEASSQPEIPSAPRLP